MIRSALKRSIKKVFGMEPAPEAAPVPAPAWKVPVQAAPPVPAAAKPAPGPKTEPAGSGVAAAKAEPAHDAEPAMAESAPQPEAVTAEPGSVQEAAPAVAAEPAPAPAASPMSPTDDTAGAGFTFEAVQEIMDEMVRPALQGDGGDITLLRIENNDIYVKLVGSCSTCPSSILTMKMGVEALLKEEFPAMNSLIQVD